MVRFTSDLGYRDLGRRYLSDTLIGSLPRNQRIEPALVRKYKGIGDEKAQNKFESFINPTRAKKAVCSATLPKGARWEDIDLVA